MQYKILAALKAADGYVSGEALAGRFGVSRVAVWKQVRELRALGYGVTASSCGYRLVSIPDLLLPAEFPGWESRIHYLDVTDSTMQLARTLARRGEAEGTLVITERQTSGRGRLDRHWLSPRGGVYVTLITRPKVSIIQAPRINLLVAVAVSGVLERLYGLPSGVKWPNDVLINGRKVCGILAEMEAEFDAVRFVNVGIGLNANSRIAGEQPTANSLLELLGKPVDRAQLVREIVQEVLVTLPRLTSDTLLDTWRSRTVTLGHEVSVVSGDHMVEGMALDITNSGALLVRDNGGVTHEIVVGDCLHRDN